MHVKGHQSKKRARVPQVVQGYLKCVLIALQARFHYFFTNSLSETDSGNKIMPTANASHAEGIDSLTGAQFHAKILLSL